MKKNDFTTKVQKMIADRCGKVAAISSEIDSLKATIEKQRIKVNKFTDVNDVQSYGKLKRELSINEDKLELLERSLNAERGKLDSDYTETIREFQKESEDIYHRFEADILPLVKSMKLKREEVVEERQELEKLFNMWVTVYDVPASLLNAPLSTLDVTGSTDAVAKLVNTFMQAGKL